MVLAGRKGRYGAVRRWSGGTRLAVRPPRLSSRLLFLSIAIELLKSQLYIMTMKRLFKTYMNAWSLNVRLYYPLRIVDSGVENCSFESCNIPTKIIKTPVSKSGALYKKKIFSLYFFPSQSKLFLFFFLPM